MFPRFFNEDKGLNSVVNQEIKVSTDPILGGLVKSNNFRNRDKYSMKSLVIADFSSASNNFKLNKLYTTIMIGVTFASFIFLTYGLSSSIKTVSWMESIYVIVFITCFVYLIFDSFKNINIK